MSAVADSEADAKSSGIQFQVSALLESGVGFHSRNDKYLEDTRKSAHLFF